MPYHVDSADGKFYVKDDTGKTVGEHNTRKQATEQLRVLYANVPEASDKAASDPGDYLVVEDAEKPSTYHLQVRTNGKPDHRLMGAAWAALHGGYRGNKYAGPDRGAALDKLKKMYEAEDMPIPGEKESKGIIDRVISAFVKEGKRNSSPDGERLQQIHDLAVMNGASCPMIYKEASGRYRWITISSNSYQDRDGEIISQKSLEDDVARADADKSYGPLRWWHMGNPDTSSKAAGSGVDIGDCDFRALHGRMLVESGTFRNETIAAALKERSADLSVSVGFFHPLTEPDTDGVYHNIYVFERSLLPRGKESNRLTALTVKGEQQDMATLKEKWDEFIGLVGADAAQSAMASADQSDKEAQAAGLKFKEQPATAEAKAADEKPGDKPNDAEPDADADDVMIAKMVKALGPHVEKMVKAYMDASQKEAATKEAGLMTFLEQLKAVTEANAAAVKELQGDLPRGLSGGFRASTSDVTILNKETLKDAAQADPLKGFFDGMGLKF